MLKRSDLKEYAKSAKENLMRPDFAIVGTQIMLMYENLIKTLKDIKEQHSREPYPLALFLHPDDYRRIEAERESDGKDMSFLYGTLRVHQNRYIPVGYIVMEDSEGNFHWSSLTSSP